MNGSVSHPSWFTIDRETLLLGLGDVALIALLVLVGLRDHGTDPLAAPVYALETMLPFLLGWLLVSPFTGAYGDRIATDPARAARLTAIAWIAAANVGLIIRSSPTFHGGSGWMFNLIMTGLGLLVLVGWRLGYATLVRAS